MMDRNAKSDAMALAYLLGEMARSLRTEEMLMKYTVGE